VSDKPIGIGDILSAAEKMTGDYDEDIGNMFCMYVVDGKTLSEAADEAGTSLGAIRRWRFHNSIFDDKVKFSIQERSYSHMEQIIEIADDATDDAVMGTGGPTINGKAIRRAEVMINTRKWVMSKMMPKVFGDKSHMELTGADGRELGPTTIAISLIPQGNFLSADQAKSLNPDLQSEDQVDIENT
jgi:hypothetical protein